MPNPGPDESADYVVGTLVTLFILYGAPLVIKADNGSPFIGRAVRRLLAQWGVLLLLSPVRRPQYNGSVEAANTDSPSPSMGEGRGEGGRPTRPWPTHAPLAGRPGEWTCQDTIIARDRANRLLRPRGPGGPTPEQLFAGRRPISDRQRRRFAAAVAYFYLSRRGEECTTQPASTVISARPAAGRSTDSAQRRSPQGASERRAIVSALAACGLLHIRRRPFTPPVRS